MALTGQLSDMSLAELIEFFCNQRKTGRLKIDYPRGHSVFFIKDGELVDAKVGALSGAEAVYFSLTLPNAAGSKSAAESSAREASAQESSRGASSSESSDGEHSSRESSDAAPLSLMVEGAGH